MWGKQALRTQTIAVVILTFALTLSGCIDLASVSKFAAISKEAGLTFPDLVEDMQASCLRRAYYAPESKQKEALDGCEQYKSLRDPLIKAHKLLIAYLTAMGTLASDEVVAYDKSFDGLKNTIQTTGKFDKAQVDAIGNIVKAISDAAVNVYRRNQLKKVIETNNSDIQTLTNALKDIVGQDYKRLLSLEEEGLETYYKTNLLNFKPQEPLTALVVNKMRVSDKEALQRRIDAADAYVKVLDNIAKGHQELYDNRNKLDSKKVLQDLAGYAQSIDDMIGKLRKAFNI